MVNENMLKCAKENFSTFCKTLDELEIHYEKNENNFSIHCVVQVDNLPIIIDVTVDSERQLVLLVSHFSFVTPEDKRVGMTLAVSSVNNMLVHGSFDFDIKSGHMFFRMANSFYESKLGYDAFKYIVFCSCQTINEYSNDFLKLSNGSLSLEEFLKQK